MHDHLGVLGVVDAALAEGDRQLLRAVAVEGVVAAELVDAQQLLALVDRRQGRAEPERLDVALRLGDPVVAHHLLELVLVARVDEPAARVARRRPRLRLDLGVGARQRARAVEVGERLALVGRGERRVVRVLLVGERLVSQRLHGVREEHLRRSGTACRCRLGGVGRGSDRGAQRGHRDRELCGSCHARSVRGSGPRDQPQDPRRAACAAHGLSGAPLPREGVTEPPEVRSGSVRRRRSNGVLAWRSGRRGGRVHGAAAALPGRCARSYARTRRGTGSSGTTATSRSTRRPPARCVPSSTRWGARARRLAVEVHRELVGVRPDLHPVGLLAPELDVRRDQVVGEHSAAREEGVVGLERVERLVERRRGRSGCPASCSGGSS